MFNKILIANRGEIACRIMRTAKAMGIKTVAVYSDADANSNHVIMADEAVCIGPPPSAESYLDAKAIIAAAKSTGAEAIHPGFGFLSENASFVKMVEEAGLVFIGPGAEAIQLMGDKITSKTLAEKAGVSVVPGTEGAVSDVDVAAQAALDIGYPVMIKASAGGGGKGMRIAHDERELREAMPQAQNEARASFGDDRVFIEKFVTSPRHIEIQILGDSHGHVVYLGERECSLQRRHQKVLEESPSPFISDKTRAAMGKQAVELAKAVQYKSAGTVEFIVGADEDFYFLEMNTRLQVEHPVTELVYDIDLVEWMIRIAAGETLALTQDKITPKGWAVEVRLYAEDPSRGFLPAIGQLTRYREPDDMTGIRIDSGVHEAGEISIYYDPMIAKVIGYGKTRDAALDYLGAGLDRYVIEGLAHNRQFLRHIIDHPQFRKGDMTTGFIADEYPQGYTPSAPEDSEQLAAMRAVAVQLVASRLDRMAAIGGAVPEREYWLNDAAGTCIAIWDAVTNTVTMDGNVMEITGTPDRDSRRFDGAINGKAMAMQIWHHAARVEIMLGAHKLAVHILPRRISHLQAFMLDNTTGSGAVEITAPMPGLMSRIMVSAGDQITAGDDVAVIEAMKMENLLKSTETGIVKEVLVGAGETVAADQPLIILADPADKE
ncbi:MAG: acetyl-CoA carboxylase biotin carboxylase subunit [Candidatus Puniceispirillales bacterium]